MTSRAGRPGRDLVGAVRAGHAADLVCRLRTAEDADPDRRYHPRFSGSDDATVIHALL